MVLRFVAIATSMAARKGFAEEMAKDRAVLSYEVTKGHHCGGTNINTWTDGTTSNYGTAEGLSSCKETCNAHEECRAFIYRTTDRVCGFWKRGPLNIRKAKNHDCYRAIRDYEITPESHCGGTNIKIGSDGNAPTYGKVKGVSACKKACTEHDECRAFVHRASDDVCGFWKSGRLHIHKFPKHTCYNKIRVDGGWTRWSWFSQCSQSCGIGTKSRTRSCTSPSPMNGGLACSGSDFESQKCKIQNCPQPKPTCTTWPKSSTGTYLCTGGTPNGYQKLPKNSKMGGKNTEEECEELCNLELKTKTGDGNTGCCLLYIKDKSGEKERGQCYLNPEATPQRKGPLNIPGNNIAVTCSIAGI